MIACPRCGQENPEGFRFCGTCGAELALAAEPRPEVRKTVTVVFCDLAAFTSAGEQLDPEALRRIQTRYFEDARACLERHGGTVEKFIGDAVMAVFGIPQVHEDDALRAIRAAAELRDAVAALGLEARIGVNTGAVVAGTGGALVTGDAVNVAARLEQAARPGEIVLGAETRLLARAAIEVEPLEPLELKGKAEPVAAYRLVHVLEGREAFLRRLEAPLVGRVGELARLQSCLARTIRERRCLQATIVGSPGIGKSRLAREFAGGLETHSVLSGRCLSYGEGITYWPLVEVFRAAGAESDLEKALASGAPEEIFWSVRKWFEARARERPLVLLLDDVHWAEPMLLDLIEHLVDWTRDAPLLLVCLARPELFDERPAWDGGRPGSESIRLEPLSDEEAEQLMGALFLGVRLGDDARARARRTAGGNPLFVEQLVAMLAENEEAASVPPTIQALLGARLDGLPGDQCELLERASVVGLEFEWEVLGELSTDRRKPSGALLTALVRKELIAPHEATADTFHFHHALIRDAAYERIPKERRAWLHERFASCLERREDVPERDELVGYHLERAHAYAVELDPLDPAGPARGVRAADHLARAGLRAFRRSDVAAAAGLLGRACALRPPGDPERLRLLPELGSALCEAGRLEEAEEVLADALREAGGAGDRATQGRVRIEQLQLRLMAESARWTDEADAAVAELLPLFEELGDDQALARLWRLSGFLGLMRCRYAEQLAAMERAREHAMRAGAEAEEAAALHWLPEAIAWGPIPAEEGIRRCERLLEETEASAYARAGVDGALALLYAMRARPEEARARSRESRAVYQELGLEVTSGAMAMGAAIAELHLGAPDAAEPILREGMDVLERLGERGYRSTAAAVLAEALNEQGRYAEAEEATRLSEALASVDDTPSQMWWRKERARALAQRGELEEAEQLAREAVALAEPTDDLYSKGSCAFALAEVLRLAGRNGEAIQAAEDALAAWERKGIVGSAQRARELLAELEAAA